jgi:hypothetical protein
LSAELLVLLGEGQAKNSKIIITLTLIFITNKSFLILFNTYIIFFYILIKDFFFNKCVITHLSPFSFFLHSHCVYTTILIFNAYDFLPCVLSVKRLFFRRRTSTKDAIFVAQISSLFFLKDVADLKKSGLQGFCLTEY